MSRVIFDQVAFVSIRSPSQVTEMVKNEFITKYQAVGGGRYYCLPVYNMRDAIQFLVTQKFEKATFSGIYSFDSIHKLHEHGFIKEPFIDIDTSKKLLHNNVKAGREYPFETFTIIEYVGALPKSLIDRYKNNIGFRLLNYGIVTKDIAGFIVCNDIIQKVKDELSEFNIQKILTSDDMTECFEKVFRQVCQYNISNQSKDVLIKHINIALSQKTNYDISKAPTENAWKRKLYQTIPKVKKKSKDISHSIGKKVKKRVTFPASNVENKRIVKVEIEKKNPIEIFNKVYKKVENKAQLVDLVLAIVSDKKKLVELALKEGIVEEEKFKIICNL